VEFRVLGPVDVIDNGRTVAIGGKQQRRLLAVLVANQVVPVERIVEVLWPSPDGPLDAVATVHTYIARLRRVLDDRAVQRLEPGYRLHASAGRVDADDFERLLGVARAETGRAAVATYERALGAWRGAAYVDFVDEWWARAEAMRLEELRLVATEERLERLLELGDHAAAVVELQGAVADYPGRPGLVRQLMVALDATGRQAEAHRVYRAFHTAMRDLGVDPSAEVMALDRSIALGRAGSRPEPLTGKLGTTTAAEPARLASLPVRLAVRPRVGVVGRDTELAVIGDCVKRAVVDGGCEVVVVSGEAGVGKTTLIAEAARVAFDGGACVLFGHCEEDLVNPYQLFAEALGHVVDETCGDLLTSLADGDAAVLAGLLPGLARRLPATCVPTMTDADTGRYQLFAAVVEVLAWLSAQQPVVLVLEDLQWADRASLQLLRHVVGSDRVTGLAVIGSCRDQELSRAHPMADTLADLYRLGDVTRVELAGLDDAGVAAFIEATVGQTLDEAAAVFAGELHHETGGNPFFVGEVLRHLAETGGLPRDGDGRWSAAVTLDQMSPPASVHAVIGGRVGRLGARAEGVLSVAAVIGRDFDLDLLTTACRMDDDEVLAILDAAGRSALVRELAELPGHYSFVHALIQHTLYAQLGPTRKARAHRQVAAALESLCGDRPGSRIGELARHWTAAPRPDGLPKALDYTRRAADDALAALAPGDALGYYTRALELHRAAAQPDPLLDLDLRIGLGIAQRQTGHAEFRETLLAAARHAAELGDTDRLAAAALANKEGLNSVLGRIDGDRVDVLELALQRVPGDHPSRPLLLAALCSELTVASTLQRRQDLADEAIALARALGDDATIVRVLTNVTWSLAMPQLLAQSLEWSAEAVRRAERLGDPVLLFWAADVRALVAISAGDVTEMRRCFGIAWSLAERLDQPLLTWHRAQARAHRALLAGDTTEAKARAVEALDIGTRGGQPGAVTIFGYQIGGVRAQRGVFRDDAVAPIERARVQFPGFRDWLTAMLAQEHARVGRLALAQELLDEFAATGYEPSPEPNGWLYTMIYFTDVAVACTDDRAAAALYERLVPYADQVPTRGSVPCPPIHHYLGKLATLLRRYEQADHHFARAAAFAERCGAAYFAAEIDLAWGQMLLHRRHAGDERRARGHLDSARSTAADGGYADVERRATAALERLIHPLEG
jgi:DNA-binding SARP family transcriptional activator